MKEPGRLPRKVGDTMDIPAEPWMARFWNKSVGTPLTQA